LYGELLARSIGKPETIGIIDNITSKFPTRPFTLIRQALIQELFDLAMREPPQTMATLLAFLRPRQSACVLKKLSRDMQVDIIRRIADMDFTDTEAFRELERELENKLFARQDGENANAGNYRKHCQSPCPCGQFF